jgi:hypothetical protein
MIDIDYKDGMGYYYNGVLLVDIVYIVENAIQMRSPHSLNNLRNLLGDNMVNRLAGQYNITFEDNNQ